jgi:SAM-dependent methyltransferase
MWGLGMTAWHEDDKFWAETAPVIFNRNRWEGAPSDVEALLGLVQPPTNAAILDLGCGQGRHALEFAERGYRVTGVDRTASYLDTAIRRAEQAGVSVDWVHADMRTFRREGTFDLVVNLLSSFGYFDAVADDRRVTENIYASLRPGGQIVMDMMGKEVLARIFRATDWHEEPDGTIVMEEREVIEDWGRLAIRWIILNGGKTSEHRYTLRLFSATELKSLLAGVGFINCRAYGTLSGNPYDHLTERLVVVAGKP